MRIHSLQPDYYKAPIIAPDELFFWRLRKTRSRRSLGKNAPFSTGQLMTAKARLEDPKGHRLTHLSIHFLIL